MEGGDEAPPQPTPAQMSEMWRERYGDMVPEKILDTKVGPDGRRYYKVQWAATTMERGNNFLEAELLIKKYWDPVQKKLVLPSMRANENENGGGASSSSSMQCQNNENEETNTSETSEANTSQFVAADVSEEGRGMLVTDNVRNNSNDCANTENGDVGTNEEQEDEEHRIKRKRTDKSQIAGEKCNEEMEEIATKRTKDDNVDLLS